MRELCPGIPVAKILIQRDETTPDKLPKLYYAKYPKHTAIKYAIICDPMLASVGSVIMGKLYECVTVHWSLRSLYVAKS